MKNNTMKLVMILMVLFCAISSVHTAPCTTNPVAEGSTAVIRQIVSKTKVRNGNIKWRVVNVVGSNLTVTECSIDDTPPCTSTLLGDNVYSSTMVTSGSDYRVTVTIHKVNRVRDQTTWKWISGAGDDSVIGQCDLDVYSFQSAPVCQTLGISTNGNTVSWTCTVSNVYPEMECRFEKKKGRGSWITQNVDTQKTTTDGNYPPRSVYHDYTCTMNLPVSQLGGEGTYQFRFTAAVVKGSSTLKTSLPIVKDLNLAYPQVELVGCPNADDSTQGYISEKDNTKTCQCRLKEVGKPPGVAQWRNAQGSLVEQDGSLSLVYNSGDQAPTYTCRGSSGLGSGTAITYKPKFAYGPSAITIAFQPQSDTMNKCEPDASFTTYCDILMANVNPKPTTAVTVSDGSTVTELSGRETAGHYRHKFKVTPEKGGTLTVTCSSFNPAFPDLKTDMSKTIGVQEPPQSSPVMTVAVGQQPVANNGVVTVTDGDDVKVTCRVNGGLPLVNEVTTTCAGVKNVNGGIQAIQTIYVKKGDNNQKCICEAKHVTGCYDKTSEFTLDVRYTPTMSKYKANSKSTELTVSANDTVTFVCNAEGNPIPNVSVRGQRWNGVVILQDTPSGAYGKKSSGTKTMLCKDTDVYTCMADNGVSDGMSKNVSVFVECVPQLPLTLTPLIEEFSPTNGTDLEIEIPIIGFPEPKNYLLKKVLDNNRRKRAVTDDIGEEQYNVTYIPDNPPKGVVVLTMIGLTGSDSGQYMLTIDNGIKDGLDYTFNVTVAKEKASTESEAESTPLIVGVVVAAVLIIIIIVIVVVVLRKKGPCGTGKKQPSGGKDNSDDELYMRDNVVYNFQDSDGAQTTNRDNEIVLRRDSDFVEHDNELYGTTGESYIPSDVVMQDNDIYGMDDKAHIAAYQDYSTVVTTMTSATAAPKNLSRYSDANENPYEDCNDQSITDSQAIQPQTSRPAIPSKPKKNPKTTPAPSPVKTNKNDVYSSVEKTGGSFTVTQTVPDDYAQEEDAYGFPLNRTPPTIPVKNFGGNDADGQTMTDDHAQEEEDAYGFPLNPTPPAIPVKNFSGNDDKDNAKETKPKPAVASKKGLLLKLSDNNGTANGHSKDKHSYSNVTVVHEEDNGAGHVGDDDVTNVYGNDGVNHNVAERENAENASGRYRNQDGLQYSTVEFNQNCNSSLTNQQRFKVVDDRVEYSTIAPNNNASEI